MGGARGGGEHNAGGRRGPRGPRRPDTRAAPPGSGAGVGSGCAGGTPLSAGRTRGWCPAPGRAGGPRGAEPGGHGPGPSAAPCSCPGQRPDPSQSVSVVRGSVAWALRAGLRVVSPLWGTPGSFGGWAGWEESSEKFPCVEMASVVRVSRALTLRFPAAVGRGTVGLEVLAGSGRSSVHIPTSPAPRARVALGTLSLRGPRALGGHPRTRP